MVRLTDTALREAGWEALVQKLGVAGALRFFRTYGLGSGDYTKTHQQWASTISRKELFELVEKARTQGPAKKRTGRQKKSGKSRS